MRRVKVVLFVLAIVAAALLPPQKTNAATCRWGTCKSTAECIQRWDPDTVCHEGCCHR